MESSDLPVSGLMSAWLGACLRGRVGPDALLAALDRAGTPQLVVGLTPEPISLVLALGELRSRGGHGASLALPVPGDPTGLAGPRAFNDAALAAGGAVVVSGSGLGLVPAELPSGTAWRALPAELPAPLDPAEAGSVLRLELLRATDRLVALDVARWQPEIADVLSNLARRSWPLPPGLAPRLQETVERALLCLEVVALARTTDGSAVNGAEVVARREALAPLGRAARHALVAVLSW